MRLLTTPSSLEAAFCRLMARHKRLSFAVAWASHGFAGYEQLLKHERKIRLGTVGIHFYQTHPSFIEHFLKDKRVRFAMDSSGVFHPKLYLFESSDQDWSCLIGSPNFTAAAFNTNTEACLLFEAGDDRSGATKRKLDKALKAYWAWGDYFEQDDLEQYRFVWNLSRQRLRGMASGLPGKHEATSALRIPLLKMSWSDYYQKVLEDRQRAVGKRTTVLNEARRLFEAKGSLSRMSTPERRGVAGTAPDGDIPWGWFGSMRVARTFPVLVKDNSPALSRALDAIPLRGEARRQQYLDYIAGYVSAFPQRRGHGLATATRLLAMKRPDYFVCLDSPNRDRLCEEFGIKLRHHDYERYWDSVIEHIMISRWWTSPRPADARAGAIWDGRTAFLDSLYYRPKPKEN